MKINCINLKRATERRLSILNDWSDFNIEFFEAIDRRDIDLNAYDSSPAENRIGRALTAGEIACSLSHIHLLQKLIDTDADHFIIIEDDAKLTVNANTFNEIIQVCCNYSNDSLFILFKPFNTYTIKSVVNKNLQVLSNGIYGSCALLYTRKSAQKMIKLLQTMSAPVDLYLNDFAINQQLILVNPSLCLHDGNTSTYIEKTYRGHSESSRIYMP